jgi:electron transfer flavoprotein alpha subunit
MEKILCIVHTQPDGTVPNVALEALTAAVRLLEQLDGATLSVGLIGRNVKPAADSVALCGATRFLSVEGAEFEVSRYGSDAAAAEAIARSAEATIVIAPATSRFSRALPGVVQRLKGRIETHVSGLDAEGGKLTIQRWYYRQRMVATLTRTQRPWFLLIDGGVFPAWYGAPDTANTEYLSVQLGENLTRTQVIGIQAPTTNVRTIRPDADVLFVAGAGWTKKQADGQLHFNEAGELILGFLANCNSSLGSSKSLVDQSVEGVAVLPFMSHLNQVGQTGSTPRHPKGLATCCHGEEPHAVGWRFINERRAINSDANCGWAQGKADVLYVADAFQVMSKVNALLAG